MTQPSTFDIFFERTKYHFAFLLDDFGFELTKAWQIAYEAGVRFENRFLKIVIMYEGGSPPWGSLARVERRGEAVRYVDGIPLDLLLEERGRKRPAPQPPRDLSYEDLDECLAELAESLKHRAPDVLAGDTEPLKRLRKKAEEEAARREAQLYHKPPPADE